MAKVVMSIGVPGSGKTTVIKKFADDYGYDYISPDDLRTEMYHEVEDWTTPEKMATWKERNKEVWAEARNRMKEFLEHGETVVFDATFTDAEARKNFLEFARESGAEKIQGILFDTPAEIAEERNLARDRHVREVDIDMMAKSLKESRPVVEDGFDSVFTLDEYQNLIQTEIKHGESNIEKRFR